MCLWLFTGVLTCLACLGPWVSSPAWEGKERFAVGLKVKRNDWPILESSDNFVYINFESLVESDI